MKEEEAPEGEKNIVSSTAATKRASAADTPTTCRLGHRTVAATFARAVSNRNKPRVAPFTPARDINLIWDVLIPDCLKNIEEGPDSPFWVVQSKNTANNVKYHAADYSPRTSQVRRTTRAVAEMATKSVRLREVSTVDYWLDNMTARGRCP